MSEYRNDWLMTNSQAADSQVSILTVLLSSSVVLGAMTGIFYLVGGAWFEGYVNALGLSYLAGRQSAEYIFAGAQVLLVTFFVLASVFAFLAALFRMEILSLNGKRIPRARESIIFALMIALSSVLIFVFTDLTMADGRNLITRGACPFTNQGPEMRPLSLFCFAALVASFGFFFFQPRLLRVTALVWGIVASVLCLYIFGWTSGATGLYGKFQIVEVGSTSLQLPAEARLLVLGTDDKNLVVLTPGANRAGHLEPRYFLRSEVKTFRIVGTASINDFVCKAAAQSTSPMGH
jgi:hypothetical protein